MQLHTIHRPYSTDYVLPLENIITGLFIYSCRDQVLLPLPFGTTLRFVSVLLGLCDIYTFFVALLLQIIYYISGCHHHPPRHVWLFQCLDCFWVIFDIYDNIIYSNTTDFVS